MPSSEDVTYTQIERSDHLVECARCGAIIQGDAAGQTLHNRWHASIAMRLNSLKEGADERDLRIQRIIETVLDLQKKILGI